MSRTGKAMDTESRLAVASSGMGRVLEWQLWGVGCLSGVMGTL